MTQGAIASHQWERGGATPPHARNALLGSCALSLHAFFGRHRQTTDHGKRGKFVTRRCRSPSFVFLRIRQSETLLQKCTSSSLWAFRAFSALKFILSDQRSCLSPSTLDDVLLLRSCSVSWLWSHSQGNEHDLRSNVVSADSSGAPELSIFV